MIRAPGIAPGIVAGIIGLIDLMPTILNLAAPESTEDGWLQVTDLAFT